MKHLLPLLLVASSAWTQDLASQKQNVISKAEKDGLELHLSAAQFIDVNLSASRLEDINLTGTTIRNANCSNMSIEDARYEGMHIDGILVTDLLHLHRHQSS